MTTRLRPASGTFRLSGIGEVSGACRRLGGPPPSAPPRRRPSLATTEEEATLCDAFGIDEIEPARSSEGEHVVACRRRERRIVDRDRRVEPATRRRALVPMRPPSTVHVF